MYGQIEEGNAFPEAGIVEPVKIIAADVVDTSNGNKSLQIKFEQPNGTVIEHREFENTNEKAIEITNKRMTQIAKAINLDDYKAAIGQPQNFTEWADKTARFLKNQAPNKRFRVLFVYSKPNQEGKSYIGLPYPATTFIENIAEVSKDNSKMKVNPQYHMVERPQTDVDSSDKEQDNAFGHSVSDAPDWTKEG